jgi:transcriptional regulator with XRE-family HTH domain
MYDEKLASELASKGYSKSQIAAKCGVSYSTIANRLKVKKSPFRHSCSSDHTRFGARVSSVMIDKDISVKALCVRSGLHHTIISRTLTGSQDIRFSEMIRIAKGLEVDLKELF